MRGCQNHAQRSRFHSETKASIKLVKTLHSGFRRTKVQVLTAAHKLHDLGLVVHLSPYRLQVSLCPSIKAQWQNLLHKAGVQNHTSPSCWTLLWCGEHSSDQSRQPPCLRGPCILRRERQVIDTSRSTSGCLSWGVPSEGGWCFI